MSLIDKLKETFLPLSVIARELSALRDLYELDLASRKPPIYRVTEEPSDADTEVSYAGDPAKPKTLKEKMASLLADSPEDADDWT